MINRKFEINNSLTFVRISPNESFNKWIEEPD